VNERGSATIWVLACSLVVLAFGTTVSIRSLAVAARHHAQSAADLAALAGADRIGLGGDPCTAASDVARANHAAITSCVTAVDPSGRSGTVTLTATVEVQLPIVGAVSAGESARAGRLSPAGG
jgi:secretion/DNA translocation related TadE-like protein